MHFSLRVYTSRHAENENATLIFFKSQCLYDFFFFSVCGCSPYLAFYSDEDFVVQRRKENLYKQDQQGQKAEDLILPIKILSTETERKSS